MKWNNKKVAFNSHILVALPQFLAFLAFCVVGIIENEPWMYLGFGVIVAFHIFGFVISPLYIIFGTDEVVIVYATGKKETVMWRLVRKITKEGHLIGRGPLPYYHIVYPLQGKRPFYMNGDVPKTLRTKKLITAFYGKEIK